MHDHVRTGISNLTPFLHLLPLPCISPSLSLNPGHNYRVCEVPSFESLRLEAHTQRCNGEKGTCGTNRAFIFSRYFWRYLVRRSSVSRSSNFRLFCWPPVVVDSALKWSLCVAVVFGGQSSGLIVVDCKMPLRRNGAKWWALRWWWPIALNLV